MKLQHYEINAGVALCRATHGAFLVDVRTPGEFHSGHIPGSVNLPLERLETAPLPGGKICDIEATIVCERESHKGIIIGRQGSMLKKIGSNARYELEQMLEMKVNLKLWVKVRKDWRDSDIQMKNFGYNKKEI